MHTYEHRSFYYRFKHEPPSINNFLADSQSHGQKISVCGEDGCWLLGVGMPARQVEKIIPFPDIHQSLVAHSTELTNERTN